MSTCMAHRGPDHQGIFADELVALGHRRLSIIDLSETANQPMFSYDGRWVLVFNGEIYNYAEVKSNIEKEFSGRFIFKTNSDSEVLLNAYAAYGEKCLELFNGMFAFAIYDKQNKDLFIARDRLGKKPLYFYHDSHQFVFASEIRSLIAAGIFKPELDKNSLTDLIRYQTVHAPATILKNVRMLMPGNFLRFKNGELTETKYWELQQPGSLPGKPVDVIHEEIKDLLQSSVAYRMVADVPVGAFLSGGIDSSAVVALMSRNSKNSVNTFTVTFDEGEFSEAKYAELVSKKYNTNHHEIKLTPADFLHDLPSALKAMDHPSGDGPNTYVVSRVTRETGIKVALSGLGGDELFAGYAVFKNALRLKKRNALLKSPRALRSTMGSLLQALKPGIPSEKISELLKAEKADLKTFYKISRQIYSDAAIRRIFHPSVNTSYNAVENILHQLHEPKNGYLLSYISYAEISTYMQNVLLRDTDQMTMAHALEVRVPFLDYRLVEYALSLPDDLKIPLTPKKLLTDTLGDIIPPEIIHRPKMGFTFPWAHWLRNEYRSFAEERINSLAARSYFNGEEIKSLWKKFMNNNPQVTWARVWIFVVLEEWLRNNKVD